MGDIFTTIIMGFTIFCIVWGFLLGLIRGGNRSILRFIMILGCAVGAFFLKDLLIDVAMTLEIEGQNVELVSFVSSLYSLRCSSFLGLFFSRY